MNLDQSILTAEQVLPWTVNSKINGANPEWVYVGRDDFGVGGIQIALATVLGVPSRELMRNLYSARKGRLNIQLVVAAVKDEQIWIFGPDEKSEIVGPLKVTQGFRHLQSALDEPNALAAYTRLGHLRRSLDTTSLLGVTNNGLFASYHLRENVPKRTDWKEACDRAMPLLVLRNEHLIKALGFKAEKTAGSALLLTASTPQAKAVAILLDESEQFESKSERHTGISPVSFGLNAASRQGVPWLFILRKGQIRIYPAKDGVGVDQKGQVDTYLEIDLTAVDSDGAGLLTLIFSAEALDSGGTTEQLLRESQNFASQLGLRLRERIYEHVVPQLAKSVAMQLKLNGRAMDSEGLSMSYRLTLRILFRLLFQAYAEDRGLLPAGRNESYDANSLKTIARRIIDIQPESFSKSKTLWLDLVQVWDAIDEGNESWSVPAYNGGLFGKDKEIYPEGALIETLYLTDDLLGPALQHLLIDLTEDGVKGPVDFRSLSVREFGTIYEGLLESSLSVASENLTVNQGGSWVPAGKNDLVFANAGEVYFHSSSGERKASGSYFTPAIVVDHLIDHSLDPALDAHLEKIRAYLVKGDHASATKDFFDFRVVDLAMGSAHFLVAAVDRIESKMRTFLAEKETEVPGVMAELSRLAAAAKLALGKDESSVGEIEPAALLRRQIARRCIYGLDINPLAVELSRLAIWIHTFVPGLPMSSLDHSLVCGNSLSGIGTVDEALVALDPELLNYPLKPGHARPVSMFEDEITDSLSKARELLIEAANSDEARKAEVKAANVLSKKARLEAEATLNLFNAAVAIRLGICDARNFPDTSSLIAISTRNDVRAKIKELNPAHMPYLFPEVFMRENPGFDVVLGNPPWEKLHVKEDVWWALRFPGLMGVATTERTKLIEKLKLERPDLNLEIEAAKVSNDLLKKFITSSNLPGIGAAHLDLFAVFAWRNLQLLRKKGYSGIVLPRNAHTGSSLSGWRKEILESSRFARVTFLVNSNGWIFHGVHGQYGVGLTVISKESSDKIEISGPYSSELDFVNGKDTSNQILVSEFLSWSDSAAFPMLPTAKSVEVLLQFRKSKSLNLHDSFDYQPVQGDINVTSHKDSISKNKSATKSIPVLMGSAFNLWNPKFGPNYGYVSKSMLTDLLAKAKRATSTQRSAYAGQRVLAIEDLASGSARIAFRLITNQTNTRTGIFCLVPEGVILGHGAPYLHRRKGNARSDAFLLAVLSSLVFDWYARRWIEINFTFELLKPMPIPDFVETDPLTKRIYALVDFLIGSETGFDDWKVDLHSGERIPEYLGSREEAIMEIDALVARLYGLSATQLEHIFFTFHRGWNFSERMDKTMNFFQEWGKYVK